MTNIKLKNCKRDYYFLTLGAIYSVIRLMKMDVM